MAELNKTQRNHKNNHLNRISLDNYRKHFNELKSMLSRARVLEIAYEEELIKHY